MKKHPVAIGENFGWIRFQLRDVHKCNRLFLDSNKKNFLSIGLLELFRITRITLHQPFPRIIAFDSFLSGVWTLFCCKSA